MSTVRRGHSLIDPHPAGNRRPGRVCTLGAAGFTLIELMIGMVIGTVALGALFALSSSVSGASQSIGRNLRSLRSSVDVLSALRSDLKHCKVVSISSDGGTLTYSLPVPAGQNGAFVDDAGSVLWGVSDPKGITLDGTVSLSVEVERVVEEARERKDLNGDGDQADSFDLCRLTRTSSNGERLAMPRLDLLLVHGNHAGDLDHDGKPDPLFTCTAGTNEVEVRIARYAGDGPLRVNLYRCVVAENGL